MKTINMLIAALFIYATLPAQVIINSYSKSTISANGLFGKTNRSNEIIISAIDTSQKNKIPDIKGLYKFAVPKLVDISPVLQALAETNLDTIIYKLKITAIGARSIIIYFDRLKLSKNAQLYLYNPDGTEVTGPITDKENIINDNLWGSNNFKGNSIILEIKIPQSEQRINDLHIAKILYGIASKQNINVSDSSNIGDFNASSPCNINVLCPQGNGWENERNAVCLITRDDGAMASGALVNNTCNLNIPYILTAWHVTDGSNPNNWTYTFGWWSPVCSPNTNTNQSILFNGATLLSTYEPTDFSLLRLNQTPSSNSGLYYLGWSCVTTPPISSTGIHHPMGDQMKISFANSPATLGNVRLNSNTAWRILWTSGTVEHGSSGSPLFNQNHQIVGQLFSGSQPTYPPCNQQTGGNNYGRFDLSWTGGGTNSTRLSNWLDPGNSNAISTTTTNYTISGPAVICMSGIYSLSNVDNSSINWTITPSGIASLSSTTAIQTTLNKITTGSVTLTATITNGSCSYVMNKSVVIGSPIIKGTYSDLTGGGPTGSLIPSQNSSGMSVCNLHTYKANLTVTGQDSYTWSKITSQPIGTAPTNDYQFYFTAVGQTGTFRAVATNGCGTASNDYKFVAIDCGTGCSNFTVSPNPVQSSSVNITPDIIAPCQPQNIAARGVAIANQPSITEIKVLDANGSIRLSKKINGTTSANINVASLTAGIYIVEIYSSDGGTERHQIAITK